MPIKQQNTQSTMGVLYVDLSREKVAKNLNVMDINNFSQAFIIDQSGFLIASPFREPINHMDDISHLPGKGELSLLSEEIIRNRKGITSLFDNVNKKNIG